MVYFVVTETQRDQLVVSEEQLSYHHCTTCTDLIHVQIQCLKTWAVFE